MKFINNISESTWDDFVKKSDQNNIFCKSKFLKKLEIDYDKVGVADDNNELVLGSIIFNKKYDFFKIPTMYNGIILNSKVNKPYKIIDVTNYFLEEIFNSYDSVNIRSHYNYSDIRAFSWYNYREGKKFKINPYYTGILDLKDINLKKSINSNRLRSINKAIKKEYISNIDNDIEILDFLNQKTFDKQKIIRGESSKFFTKIIAEHSIKNNYGRLIVTRNKNSDPVSASLFLFDDNIEYYLVGGTNKEGLENGGASLNFYDQIQNSIKLNSKLIDFVGVNSPNRAYFKTSFGCKAKLYFELSY
jgi:lipid II:glycine glycyltransferase (peptidoglycan interpeptide bridge formation enzyme)